MNKEEQVMRELWNLFNKKKFILSFNQGNPDPHLFKPYIDYTNHIFEILEFDVKEVPVVTGLRNRPAHDIKDLCMNLKKFGSSLLLEEN